jgi:hypothetical protein
MQTRTTIGIALVSSITSYYVGRISMRVAVSRRLKKIGPVITKVMVDILEKGLDENLNGEDLKAYADVQMDFVKIVIGSQD